MVFRSITIIALVSLVGLLTYPHFKRKAGPTRKPFFASIPAYILWLGRRISGLPKPESRKFLRTAYHTWLSRFPSPWLKWTFIGLALSFAYLALSGFGYAIFSIRGLFGLPLLLHVIAGGIFAISLALIVVFRSREYASPLAGSVLDHSSLGSFLKNFPPSLIRSLLFWIFSISGLLLASTALFSMLPYFSFNAQLALIAVHRCSALAALLAAIAFLDKGIFRQIP